jgi:superoxide dismutase
LIQNPTKKKDPFRQFLGLSSMKVQNLIQFHGGAHINHSIYWTNLLPHNRGGGELQSGELKTSIERDFNSIAEFQQRFKAMCIALQGSGWVWLVYNPLTGRFFQLCISHDLSFIHLFFIDIHWQDLFILFIYFIFFYFFFGGVSRVDSLEITARPNEDPVSIHSPFSDCDLYSASLMTPPPPAVSVATTLQINNMVPLLGVDLWEHAFSTQMLMSHIEAIFRLVNWRNVEKRLLQAKLNR